MLTSAGRTCLLDFGITKSAEFAPESASRFDAQPDIIVGTPLYMAPEQFEHHQADIRSDIYSLGIVLYYMLTGVYPFEHTDLPGIVQAHLHQVPQPPSIYSGLSQTVDLVVLKCLEKDPDNRYQTMEKLYQALKGIAGDLSQVDLGSLVRVVREEAKEMGMREGAPTLVPSTSRRGYGPSPEKFAPERQIPGAQQAKVNSFRPDVELVWLPTASPEINEDLEPPLAPSIILLNQSGTSYPYYLAEGSNTFGRSLENDILLPDQKVSRHHGAIINDKMNCLVEDFNSLAGTFVNGDRVGTTRVLKHDDQIKIGDLVFVFKQPGIG
jgi:serine/threonine protein kinase